MNTRRFKRSTNLRCRALLSRAALLRRAEEAVRLLGIESTYPARHMRVSARRQRLEHAQAMPNLMRRAEDTLAGIPTKAWDENKQPLA